MRNLTLSLSALFVAIVLTLGCSQTESQEQVVQHTIPARSFSGTSE